MIFPMDPLSELSSIACHATTPVALRVRCLVEIAKYRHAPARARDIRRGPAFKMTLSVEEALEHTVLDPTVDWDIRRDCLAGLMASRKKTLHDVDLNALFEDNVITMVETPTAEDSVDVDAEDPAASEMTRQEDALARFRSRSTCPEILLELAGGSPQHEIQRLVSAAFSGQASAKIRLRSIMTALLEHHDKLDWVIEASTARQLCDWWNQDTGYRGGNAARERFARWLGLLSWPV